VHLAVSPKGDSVGTRCPDVSRCTRSLACAEHGMSRRGCSSAMRKVGAAARACVQPGGVRSSAATAGSMHRVDRIEL
jgi:hypothetical protein